MQPLSSENTEGLETSLGYRFKDPALLIESLTHKSIHHEDSHRAPNHNERLEFLGDAVLSLIIAEALFTKDSAFNEAQMSKMKSYLVKEGVLYEIAKRLEIGNYLRLGKGEDSTGGRNKKSILADAVEAIIGAVFIDSSYEEAKKVVLRLFEEKISNVINKKEGTDFKSELQELCQSRYGTLPEYRIVKQEGLDHKKTFTVEASINGVVVGRGTGKSKKEAEASAAREAIEKATFCIFE
jgi:ribonuclease-3